jgi:hypothetical protein
MQQFFYFFVLMQQGQVVIFIERFYHCIHGPLKLRTVHLASEVHAVVNYIDKDLSWTYNLSNRASDSAMVHFRTK